MVFEKPFLPSGSLSFFVPCLNEEGNIGRSIDVIMEIMGRTKDMFEIIVVDDASTDASVEEVESYRKRYPDKIGLIKNKFRRGLGRNYFIAAQRARGDYFMLVNGDAAESVETLEKIISLKGQADVIVPYFGKNETRDWGRRLISMAFTKLVNLLNGHNLKYYNGPALHKSENVRTWFAETSGFGYQAELLSRLFDEGITIKEVQVSNSDRDRGVSKAFTVSNILSVANSLFHIFLRRLEKVAFKILEKGGN